MADKVGFQITCLKCNSPDGQVAGGQLRGEPHIFLRCPHCPRLIARPTIGGEWSEVLVVEES